MKTTLCSSILILAGIHAIESIFNRMGSQSKPSPSNNAHLKGDTIMGTRKIGRDAGTGRFTPVKKAQKDKEGSVVETIKPPPKRKSKKK